MVLEHTCLSSADALTVIQNLSRAVAVFERSDRLLTASEIRAKSMLTAIKAEFERLHCTRALVPASAAR